MSSALGAGTGRRPSLQESLKADTGEKEKRRASLHGAPLASSSVEFCGYFS